MLHLVETARAYGPETLAVMAAAFDRVCQSMSNETNANDAETLALTILRHVDQGESDPERLADIAIRELGAQRAPVARYSATGGLSRT